MNPIEDKIKEMLIDAGLSEKKESTQILAGKISNMFLFEMSKVEMRSCISEAEQMIGLRNKMLYGDKISDDLGNRDMIDPRIVEMRLRHLLKLERELLK